MRSGLLSRPARAVFLAAAAAATTGCGGGGGTGGPTNPHNVVIIVADAMRQDVVGCYGGGARTPNLDRLAAFGVLFENAYSTSPWTSPSAVSIFTGNYATSYGYSREGFTKPHPQQGVDEVVHVPEIYVPESEVTLMEALAQSGYVTAALIENVNASLHNHLQGLGTMSQAQPTPEVAQRVVALTRNALYRSRDHEGYSHVFVVLRHLLKMADGANSFTVHWMLDPHSPYDPPEAFASRIDVAESDLRAPRHYYSKRRYDRTALSPPEHEFVYNLYAAEVESVDERVGFILAMLQHKGILDDTWIVFTSDHGEQFGAHGLYEHGGHGLGCHYYEGLMRVPLIIAGPGLPRGERVDDPVTLLGLMPTLEDLLDFDYESDMQGASWLPLIEGADAEGPLYFDDVQEHDQIDALLADGYKLIATRSGEHELYRVFADPGELDNLADHEPERVASMLATIGEMRADNLARQKKNFAALGDDLPQMSETEREKVLEKLRALGYVQ